MDIQWNSTRDDMILEWDWREIRELCTLRDDQKRNKVLW